MAKRGKHKNPAADAIPALTRLANNMLFVAMDGFSIEAAVRFKAPAPPPAAAAIPAPNTVDLVKDPQTGEWKKP